MAVHREGVVGKALRPLPLLIFGSRWLQLPLYLGLIIAQAVYAGGLGSGRTNFT